ncbi:DegT/DnrJ/EryC1/StrS aminotransferase family protein [PVC group bacterium]|nr:DegT/DnrJ/EryC1/StrS aminotransferase family protein [PVC group bacterium]
MTLLIPPWPLYDQDELDAVQNVLASGKGNYWSGEEGKLFEQEFAQWSGAKHGLCVFNGTVALELALRACGIEHGDEVIVTPRSFLASVAAVVAVGATPVFADVNFESGNITPETIREVITEKTRGIVPVHLGGWPADMPAIMKLANEHGIKVVEDCAQAHGASINGQLVGSYGHAAAFSFCQDKIMSTGGEGGMITTNDDMVRDIAWSLRDHGRNRERTLSNDHPFGFRWLQERFGTNGRMTEMQAAIGRCQLKKVDAWTQERNDNAMVFTDFFNSVDGVTVPIPPDQVKHSYFRFTAIFDDWQTRDSVVEKLQLSGVPATVGPCPEIYREEAFLDATFVVPNSLPIAVDLGKRSMTLLVHPGIKSAISQIISKISMLLT